jgi:hypothetical protein
MALYIQDVYINEKYPFQQQEDDSGEGEDDAEVQQECLHKFSTRDYIMEPSIFNTLKRYVRRCLYWGGAYNSERVCKRRRR